MLLKHIHADSLSMDEKFCERVISLAKKHGYSSVKDLLDECDLSASAFYKWKRGGTGGPSAEHAVRLAEKLHTSVEFLMTGTRPSNAGNMAKISRLVEQVRQTLDDIQSLCTTS